MSLLILFSGSKSVVVIIVGAAGDAAFVINALLAGVVTNEEQIGAAVRNGRLAASVTNDDLLYGFVRKEEAANVDDGYARKG